MVRTTSKRAYDKLKASGDLGRMQWRVYSIVFKHGPMTSGEAFAELQKIHPTSSPLTQSRARFTELRDMGLFKEVGKRPCKVSPNSNTCIEWDVTPRAKPKPLPKAITPPFKSSLIKSLWKKGNVKERKALEKVYFATRKRVNTPQGQMSLGL